MLMQLPSILQGESLIRLIQGAVAGAVATMVIGFNWGGWTLGSTAAKMSEDSSKSAVVSVLAPICVDKFQSAAGAPANLLELKKVASYQQSTFVEKGGWATLPGSEKANSAVAQACANMLNSLK
jgi:hypothetical protein